MAIDKQRVGKLYPTVGIVQGRKIPSWAPVTGCNNRCPIYKWCVYAKKGTCTLEVSYMNSIFYMLINEDPEYGILDRLDDIELWRIGFHLVPLYHQLIKMKKEAYAVQQITRANKNGELKIHPVFGEIRAIIKDVAKEIRELKLNEKWVAKFGNEKGPLMAGPSVEEMMEKGDPDFHDSLSRVGKE